jgi:hypothetical protein
MLNTILVGLLFNVIITIAIGIIASIAVVIDTKGYKKEPTFYGSKLEWWLYAIVITLISWVYSNWITLEIKETGSSFFLYCTIGYFLAVPFKIYSKGRQGGQYGYMLIVAAMYTLGILTDFDNIGFVEIISKKMLSLELIS